LTTHEDNHIKEPTEGDGMVKNIWFTRDNCGARALWSKAPVKTDGEWECEMSELIAGEWNGQGDAIDAIFGKGFHGLRKGQIAELAMYWNRIS
jgi:hypothetical protein